MTNAPDTIRIVIPLKIRHRNGRPRILPPADHGPRDETCADPRLIRAIGRAWSWRRKLEKGEATTIQDIAAAEKISDRFVSRLLRLGFFSPAVLERLLIHRRACALSIKQLADAALLPWAEQVGRVFEA